MLGLWRSDVPISRPKGCPVLSADLAFSLPESDLHLTEVAGGGCLGILSKSSQSLEFNRVRIYVYEILLATFVSE